MVSGVWIAPSNVVVFAGQSKPVAAAITCSAASDSSGGISFPLQLVDSDLILEHPSEDSEDDVLDSQTISGSGAASSRIPVTAATVFNDVRCFAVDQPDRLRVLAFDSSGEGQDCSSPAELGLTTGVPGVFFPQSGPVPGCCTDPFSYRVFNQEENPLVQAFLTFSGVLIGNLDFTPPLPPVDNFPIEVRFVVKNGQAHFEFVIADRGEMPLSIDTFTLAAGGLSERGSPAQAGARPIQFSGGGSFVDVEGTIQPDGAFEASGRGRVAGFPDIAVEMTGTLRGGTIEAEYSMGAEGGLPGGFPLVFDVTGEAPAFTAFFESSADALEESAQRIARFDSPFPLGGADFNDLTIRTAANLLVAQAALRFPQTNPEPTLAALRAIETRFNTFADGLADSTLISRAAAAESLRQAASSFGTAADFREEMNELLQQAPSPALAANLENWVDATRTALADLDNAGVAAHGSTFLTVSAASFIPGPAAPASIVSGFGETGAPLAVAETIPLPTVLGEASIRISDAEGGEHTAELLLSSSGQFNYVLPAGVAPGLGSAVVFRGEQVLASGFLPVAAVSPGVFTANTSGEGPPAAAVLKVSADGTRTFLNAFTNAPAGERQPAPIDLSEEGAQYFLQLYGTGFRGATEVLARIGGEESGAVPYAPSSEFIGVDQANVPLAQALAGRGLTDVALVADGVESNAVTVNLP